MIQNADMRLESGTCNVCSAPCSSCMHLNRALMGSKAEEFSDENCRLGEANKQCTDEGNGSSLSNRACERLKHDASETSHMPSVSSTYDSLSKNVENSQEKYQDSKCLESLDDSSSCISRTSNANLVSGSHQINTDRINISCSSTSVSHLGAEGSGNGPSVDMSGLSECCMENVDSSLTKEKVPITVPGEKFLADKEDLNNGTAKLSVDICPKSKADTENNVDVAKDEDHKYPAHDGLHEKAEELAKSPVKAESQSEDESDKSDVVEHDVSTLPFIILVCFSSKFNLMEMKMGEVECNGLKSDEDRYTNAYSMVLRLGVMPVAKQSTQFIYIPHTPFHNLFTFTVNLFCYKLF